MQDKQNTEYTYYTGVDNKLLQNKSMRCVEDLRAF